MITCGLDLTRGGGIALVHDGRLDFAAGVDGGIDDLAVVAAVLADFGYRVGDVDHWAVDGGAGARPGVVACRDHGVPVAVTVAPFREDPPAPGRWPAHDGALSVGRTPVPSTSHPHVAGHVAAAYATSPFAEGGEPAIVLVWDGGSPPLLHAVDGDGRVEAGGEAVALPGDIVARAVERFGPPADRAGGGGDEVAAVLRERFHPHFEAGTGPAPGHDAVRAYLDDVAGRLAAERVPGADVAAGLHRFVGELLVERVTARIRAWKGDGPWNLCCTGGCATDPAWNGALAAHRMFTGVWVPPFADESGAAIGAACARLAGAGARAGAGAAPGAPGAAAGAAVPAVDWHVRRGPPLRSTPHVPDGWSIAPCRPEELARLLHRTGEPVVVLKGRAALGRPAIGGRSVVGPAVDGRLPARLGDGRPLAATCLAEHAPDLVDPGTPDPYGTFLHTVRPAWAERLPAVLHGDGTARLRTVTAGDDPTMASLLREYGKWSGVPVLATALASADGRRPFPDAAAAMAWGRVDLVWSDGALYRRVATGRAAG